MGSTRLPGKILKNVNGGSLLYHHIMRLKRTGHDVAIATTTNAEDDAIQEFAMKHTVNIHRGSEDNVLSRFVETQNKFHYNVVVRVTSDCPLIDAGLINEGIKRYTKSTNENVYLSNSFPRTFPRGFDFEIFSAKMLEDAWQHTSDAFDIEHVTPYLWKNKPGNIHFLNIAQETDNSHLRVCVDTPEDLQLIEKIINDHDGASKDHTEIETLLLSHPELVKINRHIEQKKNL